MDLWAYSNQVQMDFNRLGKLTDNAIVESFNGKFREEVSVISRPSVLERSESRGCVHLLV